MKYTSQHCCNKTMDGKMALYRECCFPNYTKSWWIKQLLQVSGEAIHRLTPHWIHPSTELAGYAHKLDMKPQRLFESDFCLCGVRVLAKPYHFGVNWPTTSGVFKGRQARHLPRPPFFLGPPLEVLRTYIFLTFGEKLIIHSSQSRSQVSTLLSRAPLQKL